MRINPFLAPIVIVVALLGTAWTAQATGFWSTSGRGAINPDAMTAADLKGWMTLQDVMDGLKISRSELYALGNIPADTAPTKALKELEAIVSVSTMRDLLAKRSASPATAPAAGATPVTATAAPTVAAATPAATAATAATATHVPASGTGTGTGAPTPLPAGQTLAASQIKGSMSLKSVSDQTKIPLDQLLAALKLPKDTNPNTLLKDLVSQGKIAEVMDVQKIVGEWQSK